MKKIIISLVIGSIFCFNLAFAHNICGIGVKLIKDPYSNRVFVFKVFPDSMASKYNLKEGSEIITINNKNIKDLSLGEINNLIKGEENTKVKLSVRYKKEKRNFEIPRKQLENIKQDKYETYWNKVIGDDVIAEPVNQNILNNLSKKYYSEIIPSINYWISRKAEFEDSYNLCMLYPQNQQNYCLSNLINKSIKKTQKDIERETTYKNVKEKTVINNINSYNQIHISSDI